MEKEEKKKIIKQLEVQYIHIMLTKRAIETRTRVCYLNHYIKATKVKIYTSSITTFLITQL